LEAAFLRVEDSDWKRVVTKTNALPGKPVVTGDPVIDQREQEFFEKQERVGG
jgi:hypothetical protein